MGRELDELGEYDTEFIDNISKFVDILHLMSDYLLFQDVKSGKCI